MFYDTALMLACIGAFGFLGLVGIFCLVAVVDDCDKTTSYSFYSGK